jgi:hypothetical protein
MAEAMEAVSRSTGWLASHAEVAEYVEELLGNDLAARSSKLITEIDRVSRLSRASIASAPTAIAPSGEHDLGPRTGALAFSASYERKSPTRFLVPVSIGLAALGIGIGFLALRGNEPSPAAPSAVTSAPEPEVVASVAQVVDPATLPSAEPEPEETAETPAAAAAPKARPVVTPRLPGVKPPVVKQPDPPRERPAPPPAQAPGDGITKRNPYRR